MAMIAVLYKQGGKRTWNNKRATLARRIAFMWKKIEVEKEGFELEEPSLT
jgi:hypothetical protein